MGFRRLSVSDCLFMRLEPTSAFLIVYVFDVLIIGTKWEIARFKSQLKEIFTVNDIGPSSYLLRISIVRKRGSTFFSQQA